MPTMEVNGANIWYDLVGSGPYLVQISGAISGHEAYAPLTPLMAEHFTVVEYDHRGYGLSDRPHQRYDVDVWADDLAVMLEQLGIERAHVHGGSMGGFIAVRYATKYPERVDRLIVGGAAAKSDFVSRCYFQSWQAIVRAYGMLSDEAMHLFMTTAFSHQFASGPSGGETAIAGMRDLASRNTEQHVFLEACQAMIDCDVRDELHLINSPTLLMVGDEDALTPLLSGSDGAGMQYMHEHIPGSELYLLEGCGHSHLFERADESARVILEFLLRDPVTATPARQASVR